MPAKIKQREASAQIHEELNELRKRRQHAAEQFGIHQQQAEAHRQEAQTHRREVTRLDKKIAEWEAVIQKSK